MSHLIKMKNSGKVLLTATGIECLKQAVEECNGEWVGKCVKRIFSREVSGYHFKPKGFKYTVCVSDKGRTAGEIFLDDFNGQWGKKKDLDKIYQVYKGKVAQKAAEELGFNVESVKTDEKNNYIIVMGR